MKVSHKVKCIDATYDEENGMLVLFCDFPEMSEKRLIYFNKNDFNFHGGPVPDKEMHRTAKLWKGKPFVFQMEDSVESPPMSDSEQFAHEKVYMDDIGATMIKSVEGTLDDGLLEVAKKKLQEAKGKLG